MQVNGEHKAKDDRMVRYKAKVISLFKEFSSFIIENISRYDIKVTNSLTVLASTNDDCISKLIMVLKKSMVERQNETM